MIVIVLGSLMLLNVPIPFLRSGTGTAGGGTSITAVYALGTVYGLAGVCAGPLLGAVLTVAAVSGTALTGGIIVLVFAAGMALPLLVLALVWGRFPAVKKLIRPREVRIGRWTNTWTGLIGGALTIAVGILLLATAGTTELAGILGASEQAALEGAVLDGAGTVPDWVVLTVAAGVALIGWLIVRTRRQGATATLDAPQDSDDAPVIEASGVSGISLGGTPRDRVGSDE